MATKAEAEKHKLEAEKHKLEADTGLAAATAKRMLAEMRHLDAQAETAELTLAREKQKRLRELATDDEFRVYRFTDGVNGTSVKKCMDALSTWSRIDSGCNIEIVFTSPGGDVINGMALYDFIQEIRRQGHYVTTSALGTAASMAGILLQAGDHRVMATESWLLIHEASFSAVGSFGEVEDTVEWVRAIQERIIDIFAARSNLSKRQIKNKWHRRDWWLSSAEALKNGFVDEVR